MAEMSFDTQIAIDKVVDQVMHKFKTQAPMKYLGKLYVDRQQGNSLDQFMIQKVVKIIKGQAAKSGKLKTQFVALPAGTKTASGKSNPACLICFQKDGTPLVKTAILNILSIGRIGSIFYYVTAGIEMETHNRFWVRAFDCRSREDARGICHQVIAECNIVQPDWNPRKGSQMSLLSNTGSAASGLSAQSVDSASSGWGGYEQMKPPMLGEIKSASQYNLRDKPQNIPAPPLQKRPTFVATYAAGAPPTKNNPSGSTRSLNLDHHIQVMDV